jgi:hypothetical protein
MTLSLGNVIAGLALLLSAYATWRSHRFKKKEEDLLDIQRKVNSLVLEKEKREAEQAECAELGASFVTIGSQKHRLKIFNRGKAPAHEVSIEFPEGNDIIPNTELVDKFPMELIEPGQAVELIAIVHSGTKRKYAIDLRWKDVGGQERKKMVHATL